ncbi:MAG: hypothetical protein ACJAZO_003748 [Myxococcota bacterium]|jgi:hypothetical protein
MLTHIVFFRFSDLSTAAEARDRLVQMHGQIPSLKHIEAGVDVTRSARSFDLALITRFEDVVGLEAYADHPVHVEVLTWLRTVATQTAAVDYLD